jgi:hypothetical protein
MAHMQRLYCDPIHLVFFKDERRPKHDAKQSSRKLTDVSEENVGFIF